MDAIKAFTGTRDAAARVEAMKTWQKVFTENVTAVGLTSYPGALIINKRFANIPAGAPIFMYNWAEDNIIRERCTCPRQADRRGAASQTLPALRVRRAGSRRTDGFPPDVGGGRRPSAPETLTTSDPFPSPSLGR